MAEYENTTETEDRPARRRGLPVNRYFTASGTDPFDSVSWSKRTSRITNPDGSVVFEMADAEIPASWSQVAADIMVSKYFRKAGVPELDSDGNPVLDDNGNPVTGPESSARQVIHRLAGCWRDWGEKYDYFNGKEDADAFYDELAYMLVNQMAAPNSPQWFNTGLNYAYGITGPAQGHYYVDNDSGEVRLSEDAYTHPQPHACFIQSVNDDLVGEGGIMDLWVREARLFKYGSGTGTNFSTLRGEGEKLSGGGTSSGLMSFLRVGDRAAGAIKSGGTTRRAAKMVCLDVDHPDIEAFITWKADEEKKVAALIEAGYPSDYNGEAYATVSGQNANNSVRITNDFIRAVEDDADWELIRRTDGKVHRTVKARKLWDEIAEAAWKCADPGIQYDTTINEWHTSPAGGRINASNPCSEYMFLDNTACNLASLNLLKFVDLETGDVDIEAYRHAVRLWTIVLEISVLMAQFPSKEIARLSYDYRTLGLGYANIGTVLMIRGLPYDSDEARAFTSAMTAIMTGESYATSAELARHLGPFPEYTANEGAMLRVMRNHRRAAYDSDRSEYEGLSVLPMPLDQEKAPTALVRAAHEAWDRALAGGELYGYRNAQTTLLAPTGTIGLLMDCDTTGVEPDFALVKFKKLAGGGYFKIANQSIKPALRNLGYTAEERRDIMTYVLGTLSLEGAPFINRDTLGAKGFTHDDLDKIEAALPGVFQLNFAFSPWSLGEETLGNVGVTMAEASQPGFDLLRKLGFSRDQIEAANEHICGTMTVEGAPHLKDEDLPVFDTANKCGNKGTRFIHHMGHILMMAAAQSFLSGAISKTINMPNEATTDDIIDAYHQSWVHGLKAMALYRDGSKSSQPLSTKSDSPGAVDAEEVEEKVVAAVADARAAWQEEQNAAVARAVLEARAQWELEQATTEASASAAATADPIGNAGSVQLAFVGGQQHPIRRRLPARRRGFTQEARVGGQKVYLRTGEYDDGSLGEIFIDVAKEGAAFRSIINSFAIAVSKGLQYGVPLEEFVDTYTFVRFEPQGMVTGHANIKIATSMIDYVFRALALEYLGRTDLVQVADSVPAPGEDEGETADAQSLFPNWDVRPDVKSDDSPKAEAAAAPVAAASTALPVVQIDPVPHQSNGNGNGHYHVNGNGNGGNPSASAISLRPANAMDQALGTMMGDAPFCDVCGHITVRNGACYKCLNCGNSLGCS
jgi:ribonucleoside-diphosphate reductase alpha chain